LATGFANAWESVLLDPGQPDAEGGALGQFGVHSDGAFERFDQLAGGQQAQAGLRRDHT